ncbi:MAG: hypothetical protein PHV02_10200 [Rhodocyclaceae bacterium]|nr:hypothetical protein [Rhodocyclaceae bacterium]
MNLTAAYGLLAFGLIFGALISLLPLGELRARAALLATGLALVVGIAPLLHGIFGTPSLTLLLLALLQLGNKTPSPLGFRSSVLLSGMAGGLYLMSSGWGSFDLYALGYQPSALLIGLLPVATLLWWRRLDHWLIILAADLGAYAGGLFVNLWDALIDPLLILLALIIVARRATKLSRKA